MRSSLVAIALSMLMAGCGGVADVKGTVSYKGELLKFGSVTAVAHNGAKQANIEPDGTYLLKGVGLGKVKFHVYCQDPKFHEQVTKLAQESKGAVTGDKGGGRVKGNLNVGGGGASKLGNPNLIPDKYGDTTKEILTFEVVRGENTYDIKLDP